MESESGKNYSVLTLYSLNSVFVDLWETAKISCYRLPTHRRCTQNLISMIPFYFRIEILLKRDQLVHLDVKGLINRFKWLLGGWSAIHSKYKNDQMVYTSWLTATGQTGGCRWKKRRERTIFVSVCDGKIFFCSGSIITSFLFLGFYRTSLGQKQTPYRVRMNQLRWNIRQRGSFWFQEKMVISMSLLCAMILLLYPYKE